MTQTELLPDATTMRLDQDGLASSLVMLIQVPAVHVRVGARRPVRRLKREFRMAAYTGLVFVPFILASSIWTFHPTRPLAAAEVEVEVETTAEPAAILISIEPPGRAIEVESEAPVVFPGYLLPADHREEPTHEGS
jgi:hypothetical protein